MEKRQLTRSLSIHSNLDSQSQDDKTSSAMAEEEQLRFKRVQKMLRETGLTDSLPQLTTIINDGDEAKGPILVINSKAIESQIKPKKSPKWIKVSLSQSPYLKELQKSK